MDDSTLIDGMLNPSMQHWFSLMFGQWIYGLTDSNAAIDHPVSALMVVLAMLNIVAVAAFMIMLFFVGSKAIFSAGATASLVSHTSRFMPIRIISSLLLLMPTTYGINSLSEHNVSISYGQVAVVQAGLWGAGIADVMWGIAGSAMVKYNITGSPPVSNTVAKSNTLAQAFICNEFFFRNVAEHHGQSRFYYMSDAHTSGDYSRSGGASSKYKGIDSLSDIELPDPINVSVPENITIALGGKSSACGNFEVGFLPVELEDDTNVLEKMRESMYGGLSAASAIAKNEGVKRYIEVLPMYEEFARRYYDMMAGVNASTLADTSVMEDEEAGIDIFKTVNQGTLQTGSVSTLEDRVASSTDAIIYLAIRLAYEQKDIAKKANSAILSSLTGRNDEEGRLDGFSDRIFKEYLGGYVNAGMFWGTFQNLSDLMYETNRYIDGIHMATINIPEAKLCQDVSFFESTADSFSDFFGENEYLCDAAQHVDQGFKLVSSYAITKSSEALPQEVTSTDGTHAVNHSIWKPFFSFNQSDKTPTATDIDLIPSLLMGIIERVWGLATWHGNDSAMIGGAIPTERGLLSGNNALMLDMNATTSPFSLVTQLGQETRDLALLAKLMKMTLSSVHQAFETALKAKIQSSFSSITGDVTGWMTVGLSIIGFFGQELMQQLLLILETLYVTLILSSLGVSYGITLIPIIGWTFIIIGILYTIGSAVAAIPFGAILLGLPKGEGVFAPDTERMVSLVFGIFIRQPLIVVGFVFHLTIAYVGLSVLNMIWIGSWLNTLSDLSVLDGIAAVVIFFVGYVVAAFYICLYSFRVVSAIVETVGIWVSTHLVGGAFGDNQNDIKSASDGFMQMSNKLNDIVANMNGKGKENGKGESPTGNDPEPTSNSNPKKSSSHGSHNA